jgi:PAS domain S-box-containing protein
MASGRVRELEAELERLRAEMRLSSGDYRHVVENIPDYAVFILDQSGTVSVWNLGASRMTGYQEQEVIGKHYSLFFPDPDSAAVLLRDTAAQGYRFEETWRRRKDGTLFWADVSLTALKNNDGTLRGFSIITRDASGRRQYEDRLRHSEERIRALLDTAAQSIVTVGADGRIQSANPMAEQMFQYGAGELIGLPVSELIPERFRPLHDHHLAGYMMSPKVRPMGLGMELMGRRRDGSEFPVEVSLSYAATGENPVAVAFISDITQRKQSELALRESESRLSAVLGSAAQAVLGVGRDGRIQLANPMAETIFRYEPGELIGQPISMLIPDRLRDVHDRHLAGYMDSPKTRPMGAGLELMGRRKDGSEFPVEVSLSHAAAGDNPLAVAFVSDITQRKHSEAALRESETQLRQSQKVEVIGQLVSGVAHDFNNILTVINGRSSLLRSDETLNDDALIQLDEIVGAGERAAALTRRLLAFGRKQIYQVRTIDVNQVLSSLMSILRRVLRADIELEIDLGTDVPPVRADQIQLEQVILNLVINAQDAMPESGRLSVRTHSTGGNAMMSIADTGCGIPENIRERIFEPFFTTKDASKGTGLGLSTVKAIVSQLEGRIEVHSEMGVGSIFTLYFPAAVAEPAPPAVPRPFRRARDGSILVVEDDPSVRLYIESALAHHGYNVRCASDGLAALESSLASRPYDLLLADVVLPGMSGQRLAERMRDDNPALKVLYISGYSESIVLRDRAESAHFLGKPFNVETLLDKVQQVLDA